MVTSTGGSAYQPGSGGSTQGSSQGTTQGDAAHPIVQGTRAKLVGKKAYAPSAAPLRIKRLIWAANKITGKPYVYGGGHAGYSIARGYDCSGTVSFALHGAGLMSGSPRDANGFAPWGRAGQGKWLTVWVKYGAHVYLKVAGLRLDTTGPGPEGPNWRTAPRWSNAGFVPRYTPGY